MTRAIKRAHQRRATGANRDQRAVLRRSGLAAGAAAGAFALTAPAAQASNVQVNSLGDGPADGCVNPCTLRDALTIANASAEPDQITFLSSLTGTIHLSSGVLVRTGNFALTIDGPGASQLAVSGDGNNNGTPDSRVFKLGDDNINDNGDFSVEGLTLTKGGTAMNGGAIFGYSASDITLNNVTVSDSVATGVGAGIFVSDDGGGLTINNSTVSGNTSSFYGGGMFVAGPLAMSQTTVSGNSAEGGAGVASGGKYAPIEITNSVLSGNHATSANGGGIMIIGGSKYDGGKLNIVDTTISGNTAVLGGAGAFVAQLRAANRLKVLRSTISGNQGGPSSFGGGLKIGYNTEGTIALVDSTISGNSATVGGGVSLGTDTLDNVVGDTGSIEFNNSTIAARSPTTAGPPARIGPRLRARRSTRATPRVSRSTSAAARGWSISASPTLRPATAPTSGRSSWAPPSSRTTAGARAGWRRLSPGAGRSTAPTAPTRWLGTNGKNVIRGRGGKDRICGLGGRDRLLGGGGRDRLLGGRGRDILIGGPGRDTLKGGPGPGRDRQRQ